MARLGRTQVEYKLRAPVVLGPSIVFRPVKVGLTDQSRPARFVLQYGPHSKLRAPVATSTPFVSSPLSIRLTDQSRPSRFVLQRLPHSRLRAPLVLGPSIVFPPLSVRLTDAARPARFVLQRLPHSKLRAPTIQGVPTVTLATPLRVALAKAARPPAVHSRLLRLPLAPVVLTLDQTKLRSKFAPRYPQPITRSIIRRPVVVSRPVLPEQLRLRTMFARHPKQGLATHWFLRGPTVLSAVPISVGRFGPPSPSDAGFAAPHPGRA